MLNKIMLIGNVGREPEMNYTPGGAAVTKFSLAVTQRHTDKTTGEKKDETTWFNCVAWNQAAESIAKWVKKGDKLFVEGPHKSRKYTDKEHVERTAWDVTVQNFEMLTGKPAATASGEPERDAEDFPF